MRLNCRRQSLPRHLYAFCHHATLAIFVLVPPGDLLLHWVEQHNVIVVPFDTQLAGQRFSGLLSALFMCLIWFTCLALEVGLVFRLLCDCCDGSRFLPCEFAPLWVWQINSSVTLEQQSSKVFEISSKSLSEHWPSRMSSAVELVALQSS